MDLHYTYETVVTNTSVKMTKCFFQCTSSVKLYQEAPIRVVLHSKLLKFFDFVSKVLECEVQNGQFVSNCVAPTITLANLLFFELLFLVKEEA